MYVDETFDYKLPSAKDPDTYDSISMKVTLGDLLAFTKLTQSTNVNTLSFRPGIGNVGTYTIIITMTDNNTQPMSSKYTIEVIVKDKKQEQ